MSLTMPESQAGHNVYSTEVLVSILKRSRPCVVPAVVVTAEVLFQCLAE